MLFLREKPLRAVKLISPNDNYVVILLLALQDYIIIFMVDKVIGKP